MVGSKLKKKEKEKNNYLGNAYQALILPLHQLSKKETHWPEEPS